jgi:Sigma-70, region 4
VSRKRGAPNDPTSRIALGAEGAGRVRACLESISNKRDREIIAMRFGLTDGRPRTLDEVGRAFGISGGRVFQIEQRTLSALRRPSTSRSLLLMDGGAIDAPASAVSADLLIRVVGSAIRQTWLKVAAGR